MADESSAAISNLTAAVQVAPSDTVDKAQGAPGLEPAHMNNATPSHTGSVLLFPPQSGTNARSRVTTSSSPAPSLPARDCEDPAGSGAGQPAGSGKEPANTEQSRGAALSEGAWAEATHIPTRPCKYFWLHDGCRDGDQCRYSHIAPPSQADASTTYLAARAASPIQEPEAIVMKGTLSKQPIRKSVFTLSSKWSQRHFELTSTRLIYHADFLTQLNYTDSSPATCSPASIPLDQIMSIDTFPLEDPLLFHIKHLSKRDPGGDSCDTTPSRNYTLICRAPTAATKDRWVEAITNQCKYLCLKQEEHKKTSKAAEKLAAPSSALPHAAAASLPDQAVPFPQEWTSQNDDGLDRKEHGWWENGRTAVSVGSAESPFKWAEAKLKETLPKARLTKLERWENRWQFREYYRKCCAIAAKRRHNARHILEQRAAAASAAPAASCDENERWLFHGTGKSPPHVVVEHETGLDPRFASGGAGAYYGRGLYLAEKACYSHSYAHNKKGAGKGAPEKQLLLVRAVLGDPYEFKGCGTDSTLTMPPKDSSGNMHHSVKGGPHKPTSGRGPGLNASIMYVLYELHQAYPEYILTYTFAK